MRTLDSFHRDIIRQMAEPDDLRELRRQAERIRARRALEARRFICDAERTRLRREIREAGETLYR